MRSRRESVRGFTLIELILVMVILVILAGLIIPNVSGHNLRAKIAATKTSISSIETAINTFEIHCGRYPTSEEGLSALISNPGVEGWSGPYLKLVSPDAWGRPFIYQAPGTYLPEAFDLSSPGPDALAGNEDDIVNWRSG